MKCEFEKIMHIASELLAYCHQKGASEYRLEMADEDGASVIIMTALPVTLHSESLDKLCSDLGAPRQKEIEQIYWGLGGESQNCSELMLVGMMCDEAEVQYEDQILAITIKRNAV